MPYTATIAARQSQFGVTVVDFNLTGEGRPYVRTSFKFKTETPTQTEIDAAAAVLCDRHEAEWQAAQVPPPDPYAMVQGAIDGNVGAGAYDAVRTALYELGAESVDLGGVELSVRPVEQVPVEDFEVLLKDKLEAKIGAGKFEALKAVLRAMGVASVTVWRKADLRT